jgi:2-oxoglutarate dehydrogenase E2 component (dihydrolipoamide succinyltransferase)
MKSDVLDAPPADLILAPEPPDAQVPPDAPHTPDMPLAERGVRRVKMSPLRKRIAQRLVEAQHEAAMLTTFNEADMTAVMRLRSLHKDDFHDRYGVKLGFMSFFARAVVSALKAFPELNAYLDGDCFEYHDYVDLSIAIGTDKGLVVPVVRQAHRMSFADIEQSIADLAVRARSGKLAMDDLMGGTFTISNGGVYGSMMSTPILNPPQSGILGLHRIMRRPVEDPDNPGAIVLRPMMYLAVSYDHRIVDGAGAVGFLVHIKHCIEQPDRLLLGL